MAEECTKCNECTENCPIVEISGEDNLYKIFFDEKSNVWNCSSCFRCEEACPQGLSVRNQIFKIRRMLESERFSPNFRKYLQNIKEKGNVFELDEEMINLLRDKMGLGYINFEKIKSDLKKILAELS